MHDEAQGNRFVVAFALFMALVVLVVIGYVIWSFEMKREAERRRREQALANVRQVLAEMKQYSQDFLDTYPWAVTPDDPGNVGWSGLEILFPHYGTGHKSFFCPSAKDPGTMVDEETSNQDDETAPGPDESSTPQTPVEEEGN